MQSENNNNSDNDKNENENENEKKENENEINANDINLRMRTKMNKKYHFVLAIGPEGGWLDNEIQIFEKYNFNICSLGPRILRTDVATVSLIAILRNYIENFLKLR